MSAVIGEPRTTPVAPQEALAIAVTDEGAVMVGGKLSTTVTKAGLMVWFPLASVAIRITLFIPTFPQTKLLGETMSEKLQLSVVPLSIMAGVTIA